jgi:uncharacterized protein YhbP (UPF0306 family)
VIVTAEARALEYLASHRVVTLATNGPEGPWAAAVFYLNIGFDLVFLSSAKSRHAQNLAANPAVAGTVQEDYEDWREIKGVQLEGMAKRLQGDDAARAWALYGEKVPVAKPGGGGPGSIAAALDRVSWYRLEAKRAYFVDNAAGFGHRDQVL